MVHASQGRPEISVVVPLFNEEENLPELYQRLTRSLEQQELSYELVLVNDGSRDSTPQQLDRLARADSRVVAVHLSRNFGHQAALTAGLDLTGGQAVILMDGDLQDPPEVLDQFIAAWRAGHDVVYAIRTRRKEHWLKRCAYSLFYRVWRFTSDLDIPLDSGDFCLMDRRVVEVVRLLPERQRFLRGLRAFAGFRQIGLRYERAARQAGRPKYSFRALLRLAVDGLVNFSRLPLNLVNGMGCVTFLLALFLIGGVMVGSISTGQMPAGWLGAILVALWLGALQLLSLGIVGEYLRRIFLETKGRPAYIIDRVEQASGDNLHVPGHRDWRNQTATGDWPRRWDASGLVAGASPADRRQ